jgi:hypothetical protein
LNRLEENLRDRDSPGEKQFYGAALTRFGNALACAGEIGLGVENIERGLQIMYTLRGEHLTLLRGELSADIAEAEENLRRYKEGLQKDQRLSSLGPDHR